MINNDDPKQEEDEIRRTDFGNTTATGDHKQAVEDTMDGAGGCTEAWEALSTIRNDGGRRSFLKGAGAGFLGVFGFTNVGSASETRKDVREALESESVTKILKELNDPTVYESRAESHLQEEGEIRLIRLPTAAGELHYINEAEEAAILKLDIEPKARRTVPGKYNRFPGGAGTLSSHGGGAVVFTRELTHSELKRLSSSVGADVDNLSGSVSTADGGAFVYENRGGTHVDEVDAVTHRAVWDQVVDPFEKVPAGVPTVEQRNDIVAQDACDVICATCVSTLVYLCPACFASCNEAGDPITALLCISCVTAICGIVLPISCGTCANCAG